MRGQHNSWINFIFIICTQIITCCCSSVTNKPHVVLIVADDLGWNDVGFHGSNQIPTPNIDALAYSGVILNNYYVMPVCTPSRSALMTGRHPIHTGMQHRVIFGNEPWGLSLEETLLPELLSAEGYLTRAVGKWHLGHFHKEYTPIYRGFDSHFGYWTGRLDYYDHTAMESGKYWGYDIRSGMNISRSTFGHYLTSVLTDEAVQIVQQHDVSRPLFLYLAHLAVHSGNPYMPLQAPADIVAMFDHIKDPQRRIFAGMLTMLDRSVGAVMSALESRGMLENSIIIFTSDNGGPAGGFNDNAASNWPLRGTKDSMWEGGVRGAACIWSPILKGTPRVSTQLAHIQDWFPTLMSAINASIPSALMKKLDGKDIWGALNDPNANTYKELLLVIDNQRSLSALRFGKWKLLHGSIYDGKYDRVIEPSGRNGKYNVSAVFSSSTAKAIARTSKPLPSHDTIMQLRSTATVSCKKENPSLLCHPISGEYCLFNVEEDPCEARNLVSTMPILFSYMLTILSAHNKTVVEPRNQADDPTSNPKYWNYTWANWKDYSVPYDA